NLEGCVVGHVDRERSPHDRAEDRRHECRLRPHSRKGLLAQRLLGFGLVVLRPARRGNREQSQGNPQKNSSESLHQTSSSHFFDRFRSEDRPAPTRRFGFCYEIVAYLSIRRTLEARAQKTRPPRAASFIIGS